MKTTHVKRRWVEAKQCPACGHARLCSVSTEGQACICRRGVKSAHPIHEKGGAVAYLHEAAELGAAPGSLRRSNPGLAKDAAVKLSAAELELLVRRFRADLVPNRLRRYAASLGVSVRSLEAYGVGYHVGHRAHCFPMYDGEFRPVGVRIRDVVDGRKCQFCVPGSRNGLFVPEGFAEDANAVYPYVVLPEGPTDCAAAWDMGVRAVGRPSNSGGADYLKAVVRHRVRDEFVLVADNDGIKWHRDAAGNRTDPFWPGIDGALAVAGKLRGPCFRLRFAMPPGGAKDLREWFNAGGDDARLLAHLEAAPYVNVKWLARARARQQQKRDVAIKALAAGSPPPAQQRKAG